jgi:hypothetical protein
MYFPGKQLVQSVEAEIPVEEVHLPAMQGWQVEMSFAPTVTEYFPWLQSKHVPGAFAPTAVEYLPGEQGTHVSEDCPAWMLYLPAIQFMH